MQLPGDQEYIAEIIQKALMEDAASNDVTSRLIIPAGLPGQAHIVSREAGVLAGLEIARQVFTQVDEHLDTELYFKDGDAIQPGSVVASIKGKATSILTAERTAINFLGWLSGIASLTARFVTEVHETGVYITDTRKTTPSLRLLEKYAVKTGGGHNHRMHLADGILIKDNHLAALKNAGMDLGQIVASARKQAPADLQVEVEVNTIEEALEAADGGADIIMLDNMSIADMKKAAVLLSGRVKLEASGGINLNNVRSVAQTGVDYISIGALTHSYKGLDFSLEMLTA